MMPSRLMEKTALSLVTTPPVWVSSPPGFCSLSTSFLPQEYWLNRVSNCSMDFGNSCDRWFTCTETGVASSQHAPPMMQSNATMVMPNDQPQPRCVKRLTQPASVRRKMASNTAAKKINATLMANHNSRMPPSTERMMNVTVQTRRVNPRKEVPGVKVSSGILKPFELQIFSEKTQKQGRYGEYGAWVGPAAGWIAIIAITEKGAKTGLSGQNEGISLRFPPMEA